ncbi:MerR family DNA-binding transcriptional regulator [Pseudomonas chlororaphis]|uniref:MerR family DNA-binding transcriptional regulator n=1 Tax=Pseudomonas chlororaphis TaxID=587753 RepID=UPI002367FA03|nr:MerR family DNA-binding transcriptional regulator [Pseudomonas chlororaphis]WDH52431.1 MerR family DNA-binding transcriptional regulator [Pseudomonas chlororaphis]
MLTIGQMARCHGLTTKTLRHYDSIGLFTPSLTRQDNGYRYYKPEQMVELYIPLKN